MSHLLFAEIYQEDNLQNENAKIVKLTNIALTSANSNAVGTILNTIAESTKFMPRLPLSIV